jgi:Tfp pilus assembly protein FimT
VIQCRESSRRVFPAIPNMEECIRVNRIHSSPERLTRISLSRCCAIRRRSGRVQSPACVFFPKVDRTAKGKTATGVWRGGRLDFISTHSDLYTMQAGSPAFFILLQRSKASSREFSGPAKRRNHAPFAPRSTDLVRMGTRPKTTLYSSLMDLRSWPAAFSS